MKTGQPRTGVLDGLGDLDRKILQPRALEVGGYQYFSWRALIAAGLDSFTSPKSKQVPAGLRSLEMEVCKGKCNQRESSARIKQSCDEMNLGSERTVHVRSPPENSS